jgi:hypothetical protein
MMTQVGAIDPNRPGGSVNRPYLKLLLVALAIVDLTGCETTSQHQFAEPSRDWHVRTGQVMYASPTATIIGEVVVRFSKTGEFELTVSKGPGVALIVLRQDATFARVAGPLAGGHWSGPIEQAPPRLRSWLQLRDKLIAARDRRSLRHAAGAETFLFRF